MSRVLFDDTFTTSASGNVLAAFNTREHLELWVGFYSQVTLNASLEVSVDGTNWTALSGTINAVVAPASGPYMTVFPLARFNSAPGASTGFSARVIVLGRE